MRESKWYSIKRKNIFVVGYSFRNRLICFLVIILILSLFFLNKFIVKNEISFVYEIVIFFLVLLLFIPILVVDKYRFDFLKKKIITYKGVFPFIVRKRYFFQEIKTLKIEPVVFRKKKFYELNMILMSNKVRKLGAYKDVNMLNHYVLDFKYYKNDGNFFNESDFLYM
jgi:hypothetical protein